MLVSVKLPIHFNAHLSWLWLSSKQYSTFVKPFQEVCFRRILICIFEYSKCRTFWKFLIYICDFCFSLFTAITDLGSLLLHVLVIVKILPVFFFFLVSPTQSIKFNGYSTTINADMTAQMCANADVIWKPIALNLMLKENRMYRQSCHIQKLLKSTDLQWMFSQMVKNRANKQKKNQHSVWLTPCTGVHV